MRRAAFTVGLALLVCASLPAGIDFYSYYEKAEEARVRKDCVQALDYYRRAINLRPQPGVNVRTYGINTLDTYYPYLGAAECALALGDTASCLQMLDKAAAYGMEPPGALAMLRSRAEKAVETAAQTSALPATDSSPVHPDPTASTPAQEPPITPPVSSPLGAGPAPSPPLGGLLVVESDPAGAEVFLNGRMIGRSPVRAPNLQPGRYELVLQVDGYRTFRASIDVPAGESVQHVSMERIPAQAVPGEGQMSSSEPAVVPPPQTQPSSLPATAGRARTAGVLLLAAGALPVLLLAAAFFIWTRRHGRGNRSKTGVAETYAISSTPPQVFGEYAILRLLGRGGMSNVYLATDRRSNPVALKILHRHLFETPTVRDRFLREADLGKTLHHPNIVTVYGGGSVNDNPYIVMEYIDGETLKDRLVRDGKIPLADAIRTVTKIAEALDYAHLKGIIHRDLKPANILIAKEGQIKVMDYGIARALTLEGLTSTGTFMGTPAYMAPETAAAKPAGPRADLYSLGIIFFELLSGRVPFASDSPFAVVEMHRVQAPPLIRSFEPSVPAEVEATIAKLLEKDPEKRYESAEELINTLKGFVD